jgi:hypothetical protein
MVVPAGTLVKIWAGPEVVGAGCCAKAAMLAAIANAAAAEMIVFIVNPDALTRP